MLRSLLQANWQSVEPGDRIWYGMGNRDDIFWIDAADDVGTDRVTFEGTGELVLGAKDDTLHVL